MVDKNLWLDLESLEERRNSGMAMQHHHGRAMSAASPPPSTFTYCYSVSSGSEGDGEAPTHDDAETPLESTRMSTASDQWSPVSMWACSPIVGRRSSAPDPANVPRPRGLGVYLRTPRVSPRRRSSMMPRSPSLPGESALQAVGEDSQLSLIGGSTPRMSWDDDGERKQGSPLCPATSSTQRSSSRSPSKAGSKRLRGFDWSLDAVLSGEHDELERQPSSSRSSSPPPEEECESPLLERARSFAETAPSPVHAVDSARSEGKQHFSWQSIAELQHDLELVPPAA